MTTSEGRHVTRGIRKSFGGAPEVGVVLKCVLVIFRLFDFRCLAFTERGNLILSAVCTLL